MDEVKIGRDIWMRKNLDVERFRNGDKIQNADTKELWEWCRVNKFPAWCNYKNVGLYGQRYGKLYNRFAVEDERGLAPDGWYVASIVHWERLFKFVGGKKQAGLILKATHFGGTDELGFSALPGGRCFYTGNFSNPESTGWHTCSGQTIHLDYYDSDKVIVYENEDQVEHSFGGLYVRCIKLLEPPEDW